VGQWGNSGLRRYDAKFSDTALFYGTQLVYNSGQYCYYNEQRKIVNQFNDNEK